MPKRKALAAVAPAVKTILKPRRIATLLALCVLATWSAPPVIKRAHGLFGPAPAAGSVPPGTPTPPPLAKEYIYAGGRLVAVEEAGGAAAGTPPTDLLATFRPAAAIPHVALSWRPPAGSVDHYEVERAQSPGGPYQVLSVNQKTADFSDAVDAGAIRAYFYRVRAAFAGGGLSQYSNIDMAVTATFADDPLNPNGAGTPIRALHFTQLRDAVNAVRTAAALQHFNWTNAAPAAGGAIRASHLNDLRANLREALGQLALPPPTFEVPDPMRVGDPVLATHVQQLRNLLR